MLKITKDNATSLRGKSKPLTLPLEEKWKTLLLSMLDYLRLTQDEKFREAHPSVREGVGLAAPQVGKNVRMLVISYDNPFEEGKEPTKTEYALVNPKIVFASPSLAYLRGGEGCLSVDKPHEGYVYRHESIKVEAYDLLKDQNVTIQAQGYDAIVLQHEIDHLEGILFYDRIDKADPFKVLPGSTAI